MANRKKYAIYLLAGGITSDTVDKIHDAICRAEAEKRGLLVRICSPGGSVDDGFAIYDILRTASVPVVTEAYGVLASMACLVFCAGQQRHIAPETSVMFHTGHFDLGKRNLIESRALIDEVVRQHFRYCDLIAKAAGVSTNKILEICKSETYLSAVDVLQLGLATKIMEYTQ